MPCNHEKVFADYILTSNPPKYPWICKLCGEAGVEYGLFSDSEYEELKCKFNKESDK